MYVEINLLPLSFRPKKQLIFLNIKFLFTVVIILAVGGLAGYYMHLQKSLESNRAQLTMYRGEQIKLSGIIALQAEVTALEGDVEDRINTIKSLTGGSNIRFSMLEHINKIMPENLWLMRIDETVDENITAFNIEGMSYSKDNISQFLEGLERFEQFSNITLESITPAPMEIRDA